MLKKTITYTDYNGNERTEDFYFNLSKKDLLDMEVDATAETGGGSFEDLVKRITTEQDHKKIIELFKTIILKSVGEKSPDGKHFVKNPSIAEAFSYTEAFVELFMELATSEDAAAAFIRGITPVLKAEKE
jgi:hypothetical protein